MINDLMNKFYTRETVNIEGIPFILKEIETQYDPGVLTIVLTSIAKIQTDRTEYTLKVKNIEVK